MEKECLMICNTFAKFDHWLFGKSDVTVHTDNPQEHVPETPQQGTWSSSVHAHETPMIPVHNTVQEKHHPSH